jgi:type II secretion system protein G
MINKLMKGFKKNNKGFTLVELMVVVVIIGVLVAIAVPVYNASQDKAKEKVDAANIRIIEGAIATYIADNVTSGTYAGVILSNTGVISGVTVESGAPNSLVPNYIKEMPKSPYDNTKSYKKDANGNVVSEYTGS